MLDIGQAISTDGTIPRVAPEGSTILSGHLPEVTGETAVAAKDRLVRFHKNWAKGGEGAVIRVKPIL